MTESNTILMDKENYNSYECETIGFSEQRRPLAVVYLGNVTAPLRIFIIAGQHGNEKYGRKSVIRLITSLANSFKLDLPLIRLGILLDANPDGSFRKTRRNAIGIDLNRDHQRLDSEETRAIHSLVRAWMPHVIIDVHNIRSKRKDLLVKNLLLYHDAFIDTPTNPAVSQSLDPDGINDLLKTIQSDLKSLNFSCDRYSMLKRSGRVRYSTLDVKDARNSLSLRYSILTILLEGRTPIREEGRIDKEHVISAQYHALCAILKWIQTHKNSFTGNQKYAVSSQGHRIAIRSKYRPSDQPFQMTFKNSITRMVNVITLSNNYTSKLEVTKYIELPTAYAVPLDKTKVIEILKRHGFIFQFSNPSKVEHVECYNIVPRGETSCSENGSPIKILVIRKKEERRLDNYLIFPVNQEGGHSLAIFLEPRSMYGLQRYKDLELSTLPHSQYPILRVL